MTRGPDAAQVPLFRDPPTADPREAATELCMELMAADTDVEVRALYEACDKRWPDYMEGMEMVEFHERHALLAKKQHYGVGS